MEKLSASPADNDSLGLVQWKGYNSDSSEIREYTQIRGQSSDVTVDDTAGKIDITVAFNNVQKSVFVANGFNGTVGEGTIVINENGEDFDFRIESKDSTNAFFVEGETSNVGIGTTDFNAASVGNLAIANGTAPFGGTANQCYLYAKDESSSSEMFVQDEAGNDTKISPHDPTTGDWEFYSKNTKTGRVIKVNMERMIHKLEKFTGEKFLEEWFEEV